jgi:mRNA interferase MazF
MNRGDIIIVAPPSPFNKPRPALVIQAQVFDDTENVTVALITSDLSQSPSVRIPIFPTAQNGLRKPSEVQVDNLQTVPLSRIGGFAGVAEPEIIRQVDLALRVFLNLL